MSQFISQTKSDIQKHLVLKAEEYEDLSEIIEAAKRIERSISPAHSPPNKQPLEHTITATPTPGLPRGNYPEKTQKGHNSSNPERRN